MTKPTEHHTKVLIIGSGPAGYSAAIYAARANLKPIQVLGLEPGGQLTITTDVENYPGFAEVIQGPWLMEQMQAQAKHVGTDMRYDYIQKVDFSSRPFKAWGDHGDVYLADSVIITTGAKARWLGLEGETKFKGLGVSACATCDGFFYKNKEVAVVGGGNTAVEESLYLANFCSKVTLIHRRDSLRAERMLQERLFNNPKITVIWDHVVEEILGNVAGTAGVIPGVTGLRLKSTKDESTQEINVDGMFVAIGHDPATEIFKGHIELDSENYIKVEAGTTRTSVHGVFAAGDVMDKTYRQAVTAAGTGCMAALDVDKFLAED
jgi:thioredoxin reductase (NADPH)